MIFLRGFGEAIGLAVVIAAAYLALNAVVLAWGLHELWIHPDALSRWREGLWQQHGSPVTAVAIAA